jgi:hypothetical protein
MIIFHIIWTKDVNLNNENKLRFMRWENVHQTNDDWHYFIECARAINDASRLLCRWCDDDITHSSSSRSRISAIKNHRKKKDCVTRDKDKYSINFMKSMIKISRFFFLMIFSNEHVSSHLSKSQEKDRWI